MLNIFRTLLTALYLLFFIKLSDITCSVVLSSFKGDETIQNGSTCNNCRIRLILNKTSRLVLNLTGIYFKKSKVSIRVFRVRIFHGYQNTRRRLNTLKR